MVFQFIRNRRTGSNFKGFGIFRKTDVVTSTLRNFLDSTKILYKNESIADVQACNTCSTLRYECDETFCDECELTARAEGEWCNDTRRENVFRTSIVRNFISRGVKNADFRTRSVRKTAFYTRSDIKFKIETTYQVFLYEEAKID